MATGGAALFSRFAFPPNDLGYCGPADSQLLVDLMTSGTDEIEEFRNVIPAFAGAWPYLELIAASANRDPLNPGVVEAYWLGNSLLEQVDLLLLGNSVEDRFRRRAGLDWVAVADGLNAGARPTHAFHVFCIYPWVGMLRSGVVEQALHVLDRCRIRWGQVTGDTGDRLLVRSRPLVWDGRILGLGPEQTESVLWPVDSRPVAPGDWVAMHWDYVCQRISPTQRARLERYHNLHLEIANMNASALESVVEK
jgi:hypothetical protein